MNNNLTNKDNILVKTDQNNLIYIDPNSVVTSNGDVKMRNIEQEDMVMYVNLEADLIPRSTMTVGNNENTLTSIAKGTFNLLHNNDGQNLDTSWSETYTPKYKSQNDTKLHDSSGQSFGIDNIQIKILGANFIPNITIKFIDVRGKTLFESPSNSPYKAFFNLPWPVFYLTVKGYYGKAIRYRIHMTKFSTRFNSSNGNFEVDTTFVGSTYAYLNDIPLKGLLNAPYMYAMENDSVGTFNESTGMYKKTLKKTSKGYQTLTSVYNEYKNKGLIDKNFPVKTLREVVVAAGRLDKILEQQIFDNVIDPKILAALSDYEKKIQDLRSFVTSWQGKNVSPQVELTNGQPWNKLSDKLKNKIDTIVGDSNTLESGLKNYCLELNNNMAFGKETYKNVGKNIINQSLSTISLSKFENIKEYYSVINGAYYVNILGLLDNISDVQRIFVEKRKKIEAIIESEMNNIVSGKVGKKNENAFGFDPTIRNITAVILANADTYIRLHKDVHLRAFESANNRVEILSGFNTDSPTKNSNIYPWPEVKKQSADGKIDVLVYPGALDMVNKLKSFNSTLWPEVDFVEEYIQVSTYKTDPLTEKELNPDMIEYTFETDSDTSKLQNINLFTSISEYLPYANKSYSSVVYEIYERAKYTMSTTPYSESAINELVGIEYQNIINCFSNDTDIISLLKSNITSNVFSGTNEPTIFGLFKTMAGVSTYDKYPYFQSQLPSIDSIKNIIENDFSVDITKHELNPSRATKDNSKNNAYQSNNKTGYPKLTEFIKNYKPEPYRLKIYPFNSVNYLNYNKKTKIVESDLKFSYDILTPNNGGNNFIASNLSPERWSYNSENLFINVLQIDSDRTVNILNTPYFHNQLYKDYINKKSIGKYAGSAYLLLNSLPFYDLNSYIKVNDSDTTGTLMSTLFREIGASHKVPYHLMIKWGSIYHRYKKFLNDNVDIISGITDPINYDLYYDFNLNRAYSGSTGNISKNSTVGFHPFYQDTFHQIVNDYSAYNYSTGSTSGYTSAINNNSVLSNIKTSNFGTISGYTTFVDNTKYNVTKPIKSGDMFTLLPSCGNKTINSSNHDNEIQDNLRVVWSGYLENNYTAKSYTGYTFPEYNQYHNNIDNSFYTLLSGTTGSDGYYKNITDLIATFKPDILDVFEQSFLEFASEYINEELTYKMYNVNYDNFQVLLNGITTVPKTNEDSLSISDKIESIIKKQNEKLVTISKDILSLDNLVNITLLNPREINDYVIGSFTKDSEIVSDFGSYNSSPLNTETIKLIKLYLGNFIDSDSGTNYYQTFFSDNNIAITEENVKQFRQLVYVYAGYKHSGNNGDFKTYVKENINPTDDIILTDNQNRDYFYKKIEKRLKTYLNSLFRQINAYKPTDNPQTLNIKRSYNDDIIKLELYNYFKSFNDKWIAGNSIGQRTLMEEFLFLDKSNKDIGDKVYVDMSKLIPIINKKNSEINLYSLFVLLLENTGFDIRALPSYVNFYGTNFGRTTKIKPSKDVAKNIFGTFLEVDTEESSPKIILQYFGPSSKHLELSDIDENSKYKGDGFDISDVNNNPIIVAPDVFRETDHKKSNRAVAFEVSVGDQNQNMFKSIEIDQSTIKNTTESFTVLEKLGNSAAGSQTSQIDVGLFDVYRQASYQCSITSMGNVMIQPTMFFYLKNVPMFRGTYWISEVSHSIKSTGIETTFKGSRIPVLSLPDPKDSFMASYRALFDKMVKSAIVKVKKIDNNPNSTEKEIHTDLGTYYYDFSGTTIPGEVIVNSAGVNQFGLSYNGYNGEKYVQKVKYNDETWLRAIAINMGGLTYNLDDSVVMSLISRIDENPKITWGDVKFSKQKFYAARFDENPNNIKNGLGNTTFFSPRTKKTTTVTTTMVGSKYEGPIHVGPSLTIGSYGIGLSPQLMIELGIKDGDVIYFNLNPKI